MRHWWQLHFWVSGDGVDPVCAELQNHDTLAISMESETDEQVFDLHHPNPPQWQQVKISGLFEPEADIDALIQAVRQRVPEVRWERQILQDQDWERVALEQLQPQRMGPNLWVCPSGQTPPEPDAINIVLDPGLAFGTGSHPTTALCLSWLAEHVPHGEVIDYGCGSGILAIAALKLGARKAWAVDVDPRAVQAAGDNAERNAVAGQLQTGPETLLPPGLKADLVMANILAGALIALASRLTGLTTPGGFLLLSGILGDQVGAVTAAFSPAFEFERRDEGDWVLLVGNRRGIF